MRAYIILLCLLLALPSGRAEPIGGVIQGRVVVVDNGKPAVLDPLVPAYVYLEEVRPQRRKEHFGDKIVSQIVHKDRAYIPHITVVPVGAKIEFPVKDDDWHNAFSPTPKDPFDLGKYDARDHKSRVFLEVGELDVYCDMHKEMWAKVKVVDSAWIAQVTNGTFTLTGVPPGTYKVVAWYRDSLEVRSEPITVTADQPTARPAELHVQAGKPKSHTRKDGSAYPPY